MGFDDVSDVASWIFGAIFPDRNFLFVQYARHDLHPWETWTRLLRFDGNVSIDFIWADIDNSTPIYDRPDPILIFQYLCP